MRYKINDAREKIDLYQKIAQTYDLNTLTAIEYCIWFCSVGTNKSVAMKAAAELEAYKQRIEELENKLLDAAMVSDIAETIIQESTSMGLPNRLRDQEVLLMRSFSHKLIRKIQDMQASLSGAERAK